MIFNSETVEVWCAMLMHRVLFLSILECLLEVVVLKLQDEAVIQSIYTCTELLMMFDLSFSF